MLLATKAYLCNAFMTWTQISSRDASPSWFSEIERQEDPSAKWARLQLHLGKFVDEFVMTEFDIEKSWHEQLEQRRQQRQQQWVEAAMLPVKHCQQKSHKVQCKILRHLVCTENFLTLNVLNEISEKCFFTFSIMYIMISAIRNFCSSKNKINL